MTLTTPRPLRWRHRPTPSLARLVALLALALPVLAAAPAIAAEDAGGEAAAAEAGLPDDLDAVAGRVLKVGRDEIMVQKGFALGDPNPTVVRLRGGALVGVSGHKGHWFELRRGDLVAVGFTPGEDPDVRLAAKVVVLPPETDPRYAAALGKATAFQKRNVRKFVGWIKQIDAESMVVRRPDGPDGREGEKLPFVRTGETVVDHLRDSWDALQKGDRVSIVFGKGRPRPLERVSVIRRGGEKPLPPGLATRLFDPLYDDSVKDVDGIGEVPPDAPWPPKDGEQAQGP